MLCFTSASTTPASAPSPAFRRSGGGSSGGCRAIRRLGCMQRVLLPVPHASPAGHTAVAESLHLLRFPPGTPEEEVCQVVDGIWSLQFMAAGPLCGSAGSLVRFRSSTSGTSSGSSGSSGSGGSDGSGVEGGGVKPPYSQAVLFRYANEATLRRFEAQPRVQLMLGGTGAPPGTGITTINFQGSVPNELEAIFKRGPEWATGADLVIALSFQGGGAPEGEAAEFLQLTQQLAVSSAYGAVQCTYGACLPQPQPPPQQQQQQEGGQQEQEGGQEALPDMVMLARFQDEAQLQRFLDCPPVAALLQGDDRIPLRALWSAEILVEPSDSITNHNLGGGML